MATVDAPLATVSFAPAVSYPSVVAGSSPTSIAIGDFDRDHHPDLAVANNLKSTLSTFHNDGGGGFAPGAQLPASNLGGVVRSADLDGDGFDDLVDQEYVYLNAHDGTFTRSSSGTIGLNVALGDLGHDGKLDLVAVQAGIPVVHVARGAGNGTFAAPVDYAIGTGPNVVAIGDVNGDGNQDVLVSLAGTQTAGHTLGIALGNGAEALAPPQEVELGIMQPGGIAVGDLDGDGTLDVVAGSYSDPHVNIVLGTGAGGIAAPVMLARPSNSACFGVAIADLNGDSKPDVVLACQGSGTVDVYLNRGDGTFGDPASFPAACGARAVVVGDLDGDGRPDVATANQMCDSISVLLQVP